MSSWLDQLIQLCDPIDADKSSAAVLLKACRLIGRDAREFWKESQEMPLDRLLQKAKFFHLLFGKVLRAGLRLNDRTICCEALLSTMMQLPQPQTVEVIDRFGFQELQVK